MLSVFIKHARAQMGFLELGGEQVLLQPIIKCFALLFIGASLSGTSTAALAGEVASEEHVLGTSVFMDEPAVSSADRTLFKQLSVAENADLLPGAAAIHAAQSKPLPPRINGFALSLQQQEADKERRRQEARSEQAHQAVMQSLRGADCDQPGVNYSECRAGVDSKIAAGPLNKVMGESAGSAVRFNVFEWNCDQNGICN